MASLTIDSERFKQLRAAQGLATVESFADALGVDKGTASRVLRGKSAPGPRFISAVLLTFPVKFEDVFTIVDGDEHDAVSQMTVEAPLAVAS